MRRKMAWFMALVLAAVLAGCGSKAESAASDFAKTPAEAPAAAEMGMGYSGTTDSGSAKNAGQEAKRIYTASMDLETTGFDQAVEGLAALTEKCEGWYESSSIQNGSGYRYADYTVRVPVEHYQSFLTQAGELCHLTYRQEYVEDISEAYYDTSGRLETQTIKLARLQALLAKADKMEDIITLESAISETEQAIDDLSGTLQHYDARVDYASVSISLREVKQLSDVEEPTQGFASRLGMAFSAGWRGFVSSMENFLVALAYGWMWVLIAAVAAAAAVGRLRKKGRLPFGRAKKEVPPKN